MIKPILAFLLSLRIKPNDIIKPIILFIMGLVSFFLLYTLIDQLFLNPPVSSVVPIEKRRTVSDVYIQLNVVNASGVQGIAKKAMTYFRDRGFDVVEIATSNEMLQNSYVIDHLADTLSAHNVAYAIGIPDSLIKHQYDTTLYLRASVIIGKDYLRLKPFKD